MFNPVKSAKNHVRRNRNKYVVATAATTAGVAFVTHRGLQWKEFFADPSAFDAKHPAK